MLTYIIRRVLYAVPILVGVSLVTFLLFYGSVSPDMVARRNLSAKNPTPQQIADWKVQHGYDKPLSDQFKKHMSELFRLDFGKSDTTNEVIWDRIQAGAGPSAFIAGLTFFFALITDIALAVYAAYFRGTYIDVWLTTLCVLMMSIPYIVFILVSQFLMGKILHIFPLGGYQTGFASWRFVLLPVTVGVIAGLGGAVRMYRTFMLEEVSQDYVRTARAKGVPESRILFRHILKNAAIPIITSTVLSIPFLITGNLLLESFFNIPGLGGYLVDAINSQDFAVVRAMVFLGTILYIIGAIMTDICYALVDPRIRLE